MFPAQPTPGPKKATQTGAMHFQALDLSFNNIGEISGLDNLTNLSTLSLFSNRITKLGGFDTLDKLQVLSVGNNLISQLDNVMYLRPFTKLQAVNLVGNPFCQEEEYRRYRAHSPHAALRVRSDLGSFSSASSFDHQLLAHQLWARHQLWAVPHQLWAVPLRYVLAHLKHIKYLDYRLVDQQAVSTAKEQYQASCDCPAPACVLCIGPL